MDAASQQQVSRAGCRVSSAAKQDTGNRKHPLLSRVLLFLILIATCSLAASCVTNATSVILSEQGIGIGVAFAFTIMLIAVAYAGGSILANAGLTVLAKDEIYHLLFSVMLLLAFSAILMSSCQIMDYFYSSTFSNMGTLSCYKPGDDLNTVSSCYINMARNDATGIAQQYIKQNIQNMMDATFSISIQIPFLDAHTVVADSYKKVHAQQYDMVLNSFVLPSLISLNMQKLLIDFVNTNVISWILPAAFLFRVIPPLRNMGNILIALSVGLYILIPFMYTFNLSMYDIMSYGCSSFSSGVNDFVFGDGCSAYGFWNVGRLLPQAFFLPNLTIALFITFMTAISKALKALG